jgi:hypothetical protein
MKTTTGLLERKRFLCAREPTWKSREPRDREIAALNRQIDHLLDHWPISGPRTLPGLRLVIPLVIPPRERQPD